MPCWHDVNVIQCYEIKIKTLGIFFQVFCVECGLFKLISQLDIMILFTVHPSDTQPLGSQISKVRLKVLEGSILCGPYKDLNGFQADFIILLTSYGFTLLKFFLDPKT